MDAIRYAFTSLIPIIQREEFIRNMPRFYEGKTKEVVMKFWDNGLLIGEKPKIIKNIMEG